MLGAQTIWAHTKKTSFGSVATLDRAHSTLQLVAVTILPLAHQVAARAACIAHSMLEMT